MMKSNVLYFIILFVLTALLTCSENKAQSGLLLYFVEERDTVPSSFTFTDYTDIALNTEVISDSTIISGLGSNDSALVTTTGGYYRIGVNGTFVNTGSYTVNGDTIWRMDTTSTLQLTTTSSILTIGKKTDTWAITTDYGFIANVNTTNDPSVIVQGTGTLYVDWGDGSDTTLTLSGIDQTIINNYSVVIDTFISFSGDLTKFSTSSNMAWSFDIANLPVNLTYYYNIGSNTTSGDIANLPVNLTYYYNIGSNTTSGDIANLPVNLIYYRNIGSNTTSGDIANLPVNLTDYANTGSNTTSGDIANLPVNLTYYYNYGSNTTSGDIANLPVNLTYYRNDGSNTVSDYTQGRAWSNNISYLLSTPTAASGLSSVEVDSLMMDLSIATWAGSSRTLNIAGNNAARTSASDAAKATLISKSVAVTVNE